MVIEIRTEVVFWEEEVILGKEWVRSAWGTDNILFLDLSVPYTVMFSLRSQLSTYVLCAFLLCITLQKFTKLS